MRRALLVLVALIGAAGCDDSAVTEKLESVATNGAVAAQAVCTLTPQQAFCDCTVFGTLPCPPASVVLRFTRFQDGACLVEGAPTSPAATGFFSLSRLIPRASTDAATCATQEGQATYTIGSGEVVWSTSQTLGISCHNNYGTPYARHQDVSSVCTGTNLEVFDE